MATQREKVKGGGRTFVGLYIDTQVKRVMDRIAKDEKKSRSETAEILLKEALQARIQGLIPNGDWGPEPDEELIEEPRRQMPSTEEAKTGFRKAAEKYR